MPTQLIHKSLFAGGENRSIGAKEPECGYFIFQFYSGINMICKISILNFECFPG